MHLILRDFLVVLCNKNKKKDRPHHKPLRAQCFTASNVHNSPFSSTIASRVLWQQWIRRLPSNGCDAIVLLTEIKFRKNLLPPPSAKNNSAMSIQNLLSLDLYLSVNNFGTNCNSQSSNALLPNSTPYHTHIITLLLYLFIYLFALNNSGAGIEQSA